MASITPTPNSDGQLLGPGTYVFGSETGERRKDFHCAWVAACEAAKVPKDDAGRFTLHFHDLRREFASRLLESGATLAEVQAALGHANITMTSRYLGTSDAGLQKAFERLEAYGRAKKLTRDRLEDFSAAAGEW
jgi:integrase